MIKRLRVREGNTGILYLTDAAGEEERYIPDYDLDKARELLLEFQELKDAEGRCLKDNYRVEGHNWYPAMVSYLYWHLFYLYIKYKKLADRYLDGEIDFEFVNHADFCALIDLLRKEKTADPWRLKLFRMLVRLNNGLVLRWHKVELMFFRFSLNDFRSTEIMEELNTLGAKYIQVVPAGRIFHILAAMLKRTPYYYYGAVTATRAFRCLYDVSSIEHHKRELFERGVQKVECSISDYVKECAIHKRRLRNTRIKRFYGFDDCNGYVFPLLYACQQWGIRTVGHQHGAYVARHAGYVMPGIRKEDYRWFDKLIVWGEYWKKHLLRVSDVYVPDMIVIGSNKFTPDYRHDLSSDSSRKRILVPYEFAANTYKVGMYITKLIELGYDVYFKPRADERVEDQLEAYCLSREIAQKIRLVDRVDRELMQRIDIVAGTMTTLVYELLPFEKIVWVFETEYRHLEDLVEDGLAHKVRLEDLGYLRDRYFQRTTIEPEYFFCQEKLKETLSKHVLN